MNPEKDNILRLLLIKYKHGAARYLKDLGFDGARYTLTDLGEPVYDMPKKQKADGDRISKLLEAQEDMMTSMNNTMRMLALVLQRLPALAEQDPLLNERLPGLELKPKQ